MGQRTIDVVRKFGLYGFVFSLPFPISLNSVFIGILVIVMVLDKDYWRSIRVLKRSPIYLAIIAYYLTLSVSMIYSEDVRQGVRSLELRLPLLLVPFLLASFEFNNEVIKGIFLCYVVSILTATLFSLVSTILVFKIDFSDWSYFSWVVGNTIGLSLNHYALFVMFAIVIAAVGTVEYKMMKLSLCVAATLYLTAFLFLLSSRMAIIIFIVIFIGYLVKLIAVAENRRVVLMLTAAAGVFLLVVGSLTFAVPYLRDRVGQAFAGIEDDPRYHTFSASWNAIREHPVLGVGIGDVQSMLNHQYSKIGYDEGLRFEYNSHNDWLNVYLAVGFLGFASLIAIFGTLAKKALQEPAYLRWSAIFAYFLASQTETILNRQKGVLLFSFIITVMFIVSTPKTSDNLNV